MCGIVGFAGFRDDDLLARMNRALAHRGPDDEGFAYFPQVSLAQRRLSILDLAGGHQPMASADRPHTLVFNGEIFNAPALRRSLEEKGQRFTTDHSDTEVLLHLYGHLGPALLDHLNGMFAFVIHDADKNLLFGARDPFGIKPLHYAHQGRRFAFASELKALRLLPWVDASLDPQSLYHYLSFQCVPAPRTIHRGLAKLPAGHSFLLNLETFELKVERYWRPRFVEELEGLKPEDLPGYVRHELTQAVARWMLSDVPVGFSLSGGIDSSAVVGLIAASGQGARLRTYSLGFSDAPDLDETALARQVARRWGTVHHEIFLRQEELLSELDAMLTALEEPYGGGLPSWFVFKEMARGVKVAMTGSGGDEVFGNYGKWEPFEGLWRRLKMTRHALARGSSLASTWRYPRGSLYPLYFRDPVKRQMLQADWLKNVLPSEGLVEELWEGGTNANPRDGILAVDFSLQLPEEFLHMTDRFSMAHSLEARTPFLDRPFVEAMLKIPSRLRTKPGQWKDLLLRAVGDLIPPDLLGAKKRGFVLPMAHWLRTRLRPLVEDLLGPAHLQRQGIFQPWIHHRFVRPHLEGQRDYAWQLWTLLFFQLWQRRLLG